MKRTNSLLILIVTTSTLFLSGCSIESEQELRLNKMLGQLKQKELCEQSTGMVRAAINGGGEYCRSKTTACPEICGDMISEAYEDINDSRGNQGGFPESVSASLDKCLSECLN